MTVIQPDWVKWGGYQRFDAADVSFVKAYSDEELDLNCNNEVRALNDNYPLYKFGDPRVYNWLYLWTTSRGRHDISTLRMEARPSCGSWMNSAGPRLRRLQIKRDRAIFKTS